MLPKQRSVSTDADKRPFLKTSRESEKTACMEKDFAPNFCFGSSGKETHAAGSPFTSISALNGPGVLDNPAFKHQRSQPRLSLFHLAFLGFYVEKHKKT